MYCVGVGCATFAVGWVVVPLDPLAAADGHHVTVEQSDAIGRQLVARVALKLTPAPVDEGLAALRLVAVAVFLGGRRPTRNL